MLKKPSDGDARRMVFADSGLDRQAHRRRDDGWLAARHADPSSRCVCFCGDRVLLAADGMLHRPASTPGDAIFLGQDTAGVAWFAAASAAGDASSDLRSLAVSGQLPAHELDLLAQARSLLHWHQRHGFCANCGHATKMHDAGYRRVCPACKAEHFPRTDPVIIIAVKRNGHVLLGRQASWPQGMYSTLAGFMEPGETIEDAARREVKEESGIDVCDIAIVANQPWPFPSSLMIGLIGEALNEDIVIDATEIEHARWFSRADIEAMKAGTHKNGLKMPPPLAIAHHLILGVFQPS